MTGSTADCLGLYEGDQDRSGANSVIRSRLVISFCNQKLSGELMASKHDQLKELLEPVVESMGCQLWGLEYFSQGRHSTVRLYIDGPDGVTLEDCERVSRQVSSVMDVEDPVTGEYSLEVSSPGMDRPLYTLEHFTAYIGEQVSIKLRSAFDGRRKFTGLLSSVEDEDVVVVVDGNEYLLPIESIEKANVIPRF